MHSPSKIPGNGNPLVGRTGGILPQPSLVKGVAGEATDVRVHAVLDCQLPLKQSHEMEPGKQGSTSGSTGGTNKIF